MKIRLSFVSNSSSSSYIIGCAKILDIYKVSKVIAKSADIHSEIYIKSTSELLRENRDWGYYWRDDKLIVVGEVNDDPEVSTPFDSSKEEFYLIVRIGNNEGDSDFWCEQTKRVEWDITPDWFPEKQQHILEFLMDESVKSTVLESCTYEYGAARNG